MSEMLDTFGVPEYFATTARMEQAGGGNIRIINCVQRGGLLIPACTVIIPSAYILRMAEAAREFARQTIVIGVEMEGEAVH